jgi:hypothetical protein
VNENRNIEHMRMIQVLAIANATLAAASALLCAAPFTPAIFFFLIYAPLAALSAAMNQATASLVVVGAAVVAWLVSPIRYESPLPAQLLWHIAWVAGWSVLTILLSFGKVRTAISALLGLGAHGA